MAAVFLGLALTLSALAVDLGHLFWAQRDLRKAADLASLSAVTDLSNAGLVAQQIAAANGFDVSGDNLVAAVGVYDEVKRSFSAGGEATAQNAVKVTATRDVPYFFLPGSRTLSVEAVAVRTPIASFSLGTFLGRVDSQSSPVLNAVLGGLLGGAVNLDILGYQGLAAANVSLLGLRTALGLASVEQLLGADLTLGELLDATITALNAKGDAASLAAAGTLGTVKASVSPALSLRVGDLLKVDQNSPEAAAHAEVNVLQLLTLGAQVANGGMALDLGGVGLNLGALLNLGLDLQLSGAPDIAIGPARQDQDGNWVTRAHSGQVGVDMDLSVLGGLVHLPIRVEAAAADAELIGARCEVPWEDSTVTIRTQPQLLKLSIPKGKILNLGLAWVEVSSPIEIEVPGAGQDLVFHPPFDATQQAASLGLGGQLQSALSAPGKLKMGGLLFLLDALGLGDIVLAILGVLGTVLTPLLDGVLGSLLSMLGVSLGGADVTVHSLTCGVPRLVQ